MDQKEALERIRYIKETMARATHSFFFSPWQWIEWGLLVVAGCLVTLVMSLSSVQLITLWISIFVVGAILESWIWLNAASQKGIEPSDPFYLKLMGVMGLFLLLGMIMTFVLVKAGGPLFVPGIWLLITGSCMFTLTFFGARSDFLFIGTANYLGGILAVTLLVHYSVHILLFAFGVLGILQGFFQLWKKQ